MPTLEQIRRASFQQTLKSARRTMMLSEILKLALDSFRASKLRFALTALGMVGTMRRHLAESRLSHMEGAVIEELGRVREELGFADEDGPSLAGLFRQTYRGGRYSWGYPACPDLDDNAKVVELLGGERVGVTVSEGFQLHPEQTTDAIICHHPEAKYFVA